MSLGMRVSDWASLELFNVPKVGGRGKPKSELRKNIEATVNELAEMIPQIDEAGKRSDTAAILEIRCGDTFEDPAFVTPDTPESEAAFLNSDDLLDGKKSTEFSTVTSTLHNVLESTVGHELKLTRVAGKRAFILRPTEAGVAKSKQMAQDRENARAAGMTPADYRQAQAREQARAIVAARREAEQASEASEIDEE